MPVNLIATSTLILYIGCHRSLRLRDKTSIEASEVGSYVLTIERVRPAYLQKGTRKAVLVRHRRISHGTADRAQSYDRAVLLLVLSLSHVTFLCVIHIKLYMYRTVYCCMIPLFELQRYCHTARRPPHTRMEERYVNHARLLSHVRREWPAT